MTLISPISAQQELPRRFLDGPGGFVWWYADMVDENGNGFVMIWSFGLPFLPGYAHAARSGKAEHPRNRPSVNLAIYEHGKPVFYMLDELPVQAASWEPDRKLVFGDSRWQIDVETGHSHAVLDLAIPGGGRMRGEIDIHGSVPKIESEDSAKDFEHAHLWGPLLVPASGKAKFSWDSHEIEISGDAYVDRNGGWNALHALGFRAWTWGRVNRGGTQKVYYVLWPDQTSTYDEAPTAVGFEFGERETKRVDLRPVFLVDAKGFGGMPWRRSFKLFNGTQLWLEGTATDVLDDGPFYIRGQFAGTDDRSAPSKGIFEWCDTERIDLSRHRFLVNMRVGNPQRNSMWYPLFAGPSETRVQRLFRSWMSK